MSKKPPIQVTPTPKAIVLDIEGTTTDINFVKSLFAYFLGNINDYIEKNWSTDHFKQDLDALKVLSRDFTEKNLPEAGDDDGLKKMLVEFLTFLVSIDSKATALKGLQGRVWRAGYADGKIKGHVYEDVPRALENWKSMGIPIFIYSSGSVEAQKLIFGHTIVGDLSNYISGYFDTNIGAKIKAESYQNLANHINHGLSDVLFLTDNPKEAEAATSAGMRCLLVVRPENVALDETTRSSYQLIENFDQISFNKCQYSKETTV